MKWLLLVLLTACLEPELTPRTQVVVALYAEQALALTRIEVEVRDESGAQLVSQHTFDPLGELPLSFGVYQAEQGAAWFMLVARGYAGAALTVEYKLIAQFVANETGLLSVTLADRCAGVFCDPNAQESCYAEYGRCVPIDRRTPERLREDASVSNPENPALSGGLDAGRPPSTVEAPVPPSTHGFPSLGGRRGDGTLTLSSDGFETGERLCTADGRYCITGSVLP